MYRPTSLSKTSKDANYSGGIWIDSFSNYIKRNYDNKKVAIVAHKVPQLAIEVLINGKTREETISTD